MRRQGWERAVSRIHAPDVRFFGKSLEPKYPRFNAAGCSCPAYPELRLLPVVLHINDFARLDLRAHILQNDSYTAHVAHAGQLHEWLVITVDPPDAYWQGGNANFLFSIHMRHFCGRTGY